MLRFRLFGIPFEIGLSFWIATALLGSLSRGDEYPGLKVFLWVVCALLSIVVHELGHALAARRFGINPHVALYSLGGLTYLPGTPLNRGRSILVSLAGPAMGLALWLVVRNVASLALHGSLLEGAGDQAVFATRTTIRFLLFMNLYWTILNLLPILPLDGGQVLRDVVGPARVRLARIIGAVFAVVVCIYALWLKQPFMMLFFGGLAYANFTGNTRGFAGGVQRG